MSSTWEQNSIRDGEKQQKPPNGTLGLGLPRYEAVPSSEEDEIAQSPRFRHTSRTFISKTTLANLHYVLYVVSLVMFITLLRTFVFATTSPECVSTGASDQPNPSNNGGFASPQHHKSTDGFFRGPTKTGSAPFLAETNPAPFSSVSYIPPSPLETQVPITGNTNDSNIYQLFGQLSHYFPSPGFGVDEYPLPAGANISWVNMLSRHGSRYPTTGSGVARFGQKHSDMADKAEFKGELSFLNDWTYQLGAEILVPVGKQELFDSGVLHYYSYGHLYNNNGSKIVARTTTQDRMTQSAEYFLAGFFGLHWAQNVTLERIIEDFTGIWNNTLAGYDNCKNSNTNVSRVGNHASAQWYNIYLADATQRLSALALGYDWTTADSYNAQSLCAYETVAFGYSHFCNLFTYAEWEGYEYSIDLSFAGNDAFQSPTGRAIGIGYVQEVLARLQGHVISEPTAQVNVTLDGQTKTFPLNQSLYFDFSHDTNIMSILTAFGFKQFAGFFPATEMVAHELIVSHLEPFAARLDIEVIDAPHAVNPDRSGSAAYDVGSGPIKYIHFILNQRTLPLGVSFPACGSRDDGWCELSTFLSLQEDSFAEANYDYACNGDYAAVPYGQITNGAPLES